MLIENRVLKLTLFYIWRWLTTQNHFEQDIGAYGVYVLETPPIAESLASIHKMQRLEDIPWPERNCIVFVRLPKLEGYESGGVDFWCREHCYIRSQFADTFGCALVVPLLSGASGGYVFPRRLVRLRRGAMDEPFTSLEVGALDHIANDALPASTIETLLKHRVVWQDDACCWDTVKGNDDWPEEAYWEDEPDVSCTERAAYAVPIIATLTPLVSATGYTVHVRHPPFGPERFRRSFGGKPIIARIGYERFYRLCRAACPEDPMHERAVPLHHRRGHLRHLWKRSGIHLEQLPRRAAERDYLAVERDVKLVQVKECWVGRSEFTLDGVIYTIAPDYPWGAT